MEKEVEISERVNTKMEINEKFKKAVEEAITKFKMHDWGDTPKDEYEFNQISLERGWGMILGFYNTDFGIVHVFIQGKHDQKQNRIQVCFCNEYM